MQNRHALRRGQLAVVTGGSSGLGLAIATELAGRGLDVALLARNRKRLDGAREHILRASPAARVRLYAVDVGDYDAVRAAIEDIAASTPGIDVVINSAGTLREGYFETVGDVDFHTVMDIDFFGVVNVTRACLPYLKATHGRIVNIGSMAGLIGVFGYTAYCAAKFAVTGFTEALRVEVEPAGVSIHLVCPGEFDSPMVDELNTYRTPENRALVGAFPAMRVAEVARAVVAGIDRRDPLIIPCRTLRSAWLAQRLAPGLMRRFLRRQVASVYQGPPALTDHA